MRCFFIFPWAVTVLLAAAAVADLPSDFPADALQHEKIQNLSALNLLEASKTGAVEVPFDLALDLFRRDDFLMQVQEAYAALLPEGEDPEFTVQELRPGYYSYTNRKDQTSNIEKVLLEDRDADTLRLLLFTDGKRFFGFFEAVVDIRVSADGAHRSRYEVQVYAHPRNGVSRFFARHLNLVQRYFDGKTGELAELSEQISSYLAEHRS